MRLDTKISIVDMDIFKDIVDVLKNVREITQDSKTVEYIDRKIDELLAKYKERDIEHIINPPKY